MVDKEAEVSRIAGWYLKTGWTKDGLGDFSTALKKPVELFSWEERAWWNGYQRGLREGYEMACKKKGKGGKGKGGR